MEDVALLFERVYAVAAVWLVVLAAGRAGARLLPKRLAAEGWVVWVPLGIALWSIALFVLPFSGGMAIALILFLLLGWHAPRSRSHGWGGWLLLVGILVYATPLATQLVPLGMDASMHATAARVLGSNMGWTDAYRPFASELPFPAINLGPAMPAAVAVMLGARPEAATVSASHLVYVCWLLANYLLVRSWAVRPLQAATLALVLCWGSRGVQDTLAWGGFGTVAGVALGALAARVFLEAARRPSISAGVALGLVAAAIPLAHGVAAAIWLYVAAVPLLLLAARRNSLQLTHAKSLLAAGVVCCVVLGAYFVVGHPKLTPEAVEWTREWQKGYAPKLNRPLWDVLRRFLAGTAGDVPAVALLLGAAGCVYARRWKAAVALLWASAALLLLPLNALRWTLPASALLYPERVGYLGTSVALAALAGVATIPLVRRSPARFKAIAGLAALAFALPSHIHNYQRPAFRRPVNLAQYRLLRSVETMPGRERLFVEAPYQSPGSYLPCVAGVVCDGWHLHHALLEEGHALYRNRTHTHRLVAAEGAWRLEPLTELASAEAAARR